MVIINRGSIFEYDGAAPGTTVTGSKVRAAKTWKYCPYSTQVTDYNQDSRVPGGEKTYHEETNGRMHVYSLGGAFGWICADNGCSFFLGTATTELGQKGRKFVPASGTTACAEDLPTISGSVDHSLINRAIVPGTRYLEL